MNYKSNHFRRGLPRRLFASILAVCMVFTMMPPVMAAGVTDSGKILLSGFAKLPENIREQRVPLGVSLDELTLPDTLEAMVYTVSEDTQPAEPEETTPPVTEEQPVADTPNDAAQDEQSDTAPPAQWDEPASKAEIIEENDVPLAASLSDAQDKAAPNAGGHKTVIISGIIWKSDPLYDSETEGTYTLIAVLPSGYTVEDGIAMPEITVVVGQAEQSAVDKVIAMIDALPTMDEWTAMDETAARAVMEKILAAKKAYDALTTEKKAQIDETRTAKLTELAEMARQLKNTMPMSEDVDLIFKADTPDKSGTGYAWVEDTQTLTLNGYTSTDGGGIGIQLPDGATLVINGTNSLTVTGGESIDGDADSRVSYRG